MDIGLSTREVEITVLNKLIKEKRDIHAYLHSSRSGHIISSNSSLKLGIKSMEENDYLHISMQRGPGHQENYCILDLPSFLDFKFSNSGEVVLVHTGERTLLRIPPGPPLWEIKIKPKMRFSCQPLDNQGHITIGDGEEWPGDSFENV